ncbi:transglycosylase domain-containing protein [Paradesertivirga mongoliensis]|uniref:Transglycosylase domain-containing protein n=1 Tax=Paradesertivirga mongoliensis TaxID=2100740 RepID=A0ABW4ZHC0_9SPHI|nr:transglycosylase domain-containing protein [Pedobacter mongoliensis]
MRNRISPKYIKIIVISLLCLLLLFFIGIFIAYSKREAILNAVIAKAVIKAKRDYNLNVTISDPHFEGLTKVAFSNISVVPQGRDTLANINDLHVGVKLFPLISGDIKLASLSIKNGRINLVKRDSIRNYDFLFRKKNRDSTKTSKADLAALANRLLNQVLHKIPDEMSVANLDVVINHDEDKLRFFTTSATIDDGQLKSNIRVNDTEALWHLDGTVEPGDKHLAFKLYAERTKVELSMIEKKLGLKLNFDTVSAQLKKAVKDGDQFRIYGSWAIKNLLINHPKLAANNIVVPSGAIDADVVIGENFIALDSTSVIHLKNIKANPYIKYTKTPKKTYALKLKTDDLNAQELFNSFPVGLFESLEGIKVAGKLRYNLDFFLDSKNPDAVRINSSLHKSKDFRILKWGKTNLQKINAPFVYTPYEYGKPMRNITIGPQNPDYVPIGQISPNLRNALLTAEDPSFYSHNGFVEKAFQRSIATNFKEKAFKRGGSTISMQLVKNVFLSRQKTLARKVEEILIVWLIENNRISSKQRMFEVYLNLIEWGNNVYGIGEAARYYFGKHPSELSLGESIFLANIVPRPKKGLYFFEADGSLSQSLRGYFKLIGGLMARRGYTSRDTNAYGFYGVRLKESLRRRVDPVDSIAIDSLYDDEGVQYKSEGGFFRSLFGRRNQDTVQIDQKNRTFIKKDSIASPAELRQQRREQRRREREQRKNGS